MGDIKKTFTATITKGEGKQEGLFLFVISDGLMDRHSESVNPNGWDFTEFNDNPVCLVGHDYSELMVGNWLPPFVENGQVKAYLKLAETPRGEEARYLIENNFLKTVSVGFRVKEWGRNGDTHTIMKQTLYEVSLVSVPANTRAQRIKDAKALEMFANIDAEMSKKVVTVSVEQLVNTFTETVKNVVAETLKGVKVVEEKKVEVIKYVEGKPLSEGALTLLLGIQKQNEKITKKQDNVGFLLNSILNVKNSREGGESK